MNIAEILKDCPKGTKLYSPLCGECKLDTVTCKSILVESTNFKTLDFNEDGTYYEGYDDAECLLFPSKDQRDWSKFQRPFEDGEVVAYSNSYREHSQIFIFKDKKENSTLSNCYLMLDGDELDIEEGAYYVTRLATEEEKKKLFDAIKANGYKWNEETKTLEKMVESHTTEKVYIRIGDIPSEEKSAVYKGDVVIGYEDGVSVYDCIETDGLYRIVMPFPLNEGQGMTYECLIQEITQCRYKIENPRNVYLVSGMEVGKGHDNETLIKEVKILKDLTGQFNTKTNNTEETKTMEKLPKFKVGDSIKKKNGISVPVEITSIGDEFYYSNTYKGIGILSIAEQDDYELVTDKFDISTLKPFDKVLVRDDNDENWAINWYGYYNKEDNTFRCIGNCDIGWEQCIPYEGNEHLLGTTDDCDEFYKTW